MALQDIDPPLDFAGSHSNTFQDTETISNVPSGVNSGITSEDGRPFTRPTTGKSRHSFESSRLSLLRSPSAQDSSKSRRGSFSFRNLRSSSEPQDSRRSLDGLRSEISSNSSASQIRSTVRTLAKRLDKVAISSRAAVDRLSPAAREVEKPIADPLDAWGRDLEIILGAALGISENLQAKFFDKYGEAIKGDMRAWSLEKQNARIKTLDHQMFTTIAFYGDNGTGKSSLINALLDSECITPTSNGDSCTATPIEFRTIDRSQNMTKRYTLIADILTKEEWLLVAQRLLEGSRESPQDPKADRARKTLGSLFDLKLAEDKPITLAMIEELPSGREGLDERFETHELFQLQEHVEELNTSYWPILKKITIYMDSPVLNTGVILVDLPGLREIDPMKIEMASSYLKTCETIFVVSNISRAVNNVDHLLSNPVLVPIARQVQLDSSSNISFILTQIDNITQTRNNPDWDKKEAIQERIEKARQQFKISPQPQIKNAQMFCVSSLEYQWHHKRLVGLNISSCLSAEDSGIPDLRRFIQEKGLRQRESVTKSLVQGDMKTFLSSIWGWCEGRETTLPGIKQFEELQKEVDKVLATQGLKLLADIITGFKNDVLDEEVFEKAAAEAIEASTTFKAACKRFGDKDDGTVVHWNSELAAPLVPRVDGLWKSHFHLDLKPDGESSSRGPVILKSLSTIIHQEICDSVGTIDPGYGFNLGLQSIRLQIDGIVEREDKNTLVTGLGYVELKEKKAPMPNVGPSATELDISLMYLNRDIAQKFTIENEKAIKEDMKPTYKACTGVKTLGDIGKATRIEVMRTALPSVVGEHYKKLRKDIFLELDKLVLLVGENITKELEPILDIIKSNYFSAPEISTNDLSAIKSELLTLSKFMAEIEERASKYFEHGTRGTLASERLGV